MAPTAKRMRPTLKLVRDYFATLKRFQSHGVKHEQAVRSAFQALLADAGKKHKWTLIPELEARINGKRVVPDGTFRDHYNLPRGYWEAKDTNDNLNVEIQKKIEKGYPLNNMIFWTPDRAVLYQDKARVLDVDIDASDSGPAELCGVLNRFFEYAEKPIVDFESAIREFNERVPDLGRRLAEILTDAHRSDQRFQARFDKFFDLCKTALNPNISRDAVDEMLVQHLLTERLFRSIFDNPEFVRRNVIAREVAEVIDALASRSFTREEFLSRLDRFYHAIERAADAIDDFADKQHFLNTIYERFFQGYCVKTADTHGIVYTPQPIVDFMCQSVEDVLDREFNKKLGDDGVLILDPCTGTGNFVVNLLRRAAKRGRSHLKKMYREQLFANEVMLMPYYIAALNIEHEYYELTGEYEPFEGLCFVDTLELAEAKSQIGLFSERNLERVKRQKSAPITVVIGNPPYNVGQMTHNERNQNRKYPAIDLRVKVTYGRASKATSVSKLNDPYVKFFRWATDRLQDRTGIVCLVSNNSFVAKSAFDGMRKHMATDFGAIYHLDLQGDVRQNPTLSGTQYNVFGIQVGVGITVAVRGVGLRSSGIRYHVLDKALPRVDKLGSLERLGSVSGVNWDSLKPDAASSWLHPQNIDEFRSFVRLGERAARARQAAAPDVIFSDYTLGFSSHRDPVVYDYARMQLSKRVSEFIDAYNAEIDRWKRAGRPKDKAGFVRYETVLWNRELLNNLGRERYAEFAADFIVDAAYRPFAKMLLYSDPILNAFPAGWARILPTTGDEPPDNQAIAVGGYDRKPFAALVVDRIHDLNLWTDPAQSFPLYTYERGGGERRENITDWALGAFRAHYKSKRISKRNIFDYVYAVLHHQGYRERFGECLKKELPRVPLAPEFRTFVDIGSALAMLHLHYDNPEIVKPYALREIWTAGLPRSLSVEQMKLSKDRASLRVSDALTLDGIPPDVFSYRLGNRSALEWIIDQYRVRTDKRTGITSDPNAWGREHDDEEYIIRLVKQTVTVSLETLRLVRELPEDIGGGLREEVRESDDAYTPVERDEASSDRQKFTLRSDPPPPTRLPLDGA